jgi:hypothetical protein
MKATLVLGAFLAAVLIASPVLAKQGDPIPGTDVGLEHDPGSVVISKAQTNGAGVAVFPNVKPGKYRLTVSSIFDRWGNLRSTAVIEITVPRQANISDNESPRPDDRSMKTADQRLVPFTVTGNEVRTVTVMLTQGSESK